MVDKFENFLNSAQREVDESQIIIQPEYLYAYSLDATRKKTIPKAVFLPQTLEQLIAVVKKCKENDINITPRGSGTGLSGGAVPTDNSLLISFTKMNKIIDIDETDLIAKVEPGVITKNLQNKVEKRDLFYPPDPSSAAVSTIGGNIAECSGGPRALKYGVTRDYVVGLEAVLVDGTVINTGGLTYKNVSGLDLTRLLVGSEGTLALITKANLRLLPKPIQNTTYIIGFNSPEKAGGAVVQIINSSILPSALEIIDKTCIDSVNKFQAGNGFDVDEKTKAILLIEIDGYDTAQQEKIIDKVIKKIKPLNYYKAKEKTKKEVIWEARKAILPALSSCGPNLILEDATVPRSQICNLMNGIDKISKKYDLLIGCFGHAGDGNLHPTIITDLRDEKKSQAVESAMDEIFELALSLGGTLSGEHGIGTVKRKYLESEIGEKSISLIKGIKKVFDKDNLLNSGKIVEE